MDAVTVILKDADEVWQFVNTMRKFEGEYDLEAGSYSVDAKSVLGVCALGTGKPLKLRMVNPRGEESQLITQLNKYLVKEKAGE